MRLDPSRLRLSRPLLEPTAEEWQEIDQRVPRAQAWKGSEHDAQKQLIQLANLHQRQHQELSRLHAIPNGGHRSKAAAGKMKAEGQRPGVPDLCLPVPRGPLHGLYVEMKTASGSASPDQKDWLTHLHRNRYAAHLTNCPQRALQIILEYLNP